jgi:predicted DNA binding CopG/RHH family protein
MYTIEYMKRQSSPKQVVVCTRVPEKVKEALKGKAHKKGVNLGEFLRWHLIEFAESKTKEG